MDSIKLPQHPQLPVRFERGVLHVTLNRPEMRNAMTQDMVLAIRALFEAVSGDRSVRAIVLRGAGGHFCAGGDLKEMLASGVSPAVDGEADPIAANSRVFGETLQVIEAAPQVVIVICEGAVLGGGVGLTCVSDIAFSRPDARFGLPETARGLLPAQIAPFVVERIGLTHARRLCLTGAFFDGAEALRLGLVHEGFSDEAELSTKLAATLEQVLNCAPEANAVTKEILLDVGRKPMSEVLDDAARKFATAVRGPEAPEGVTAFVQKRKPKWANPA